MLKLLHQKLISFFKNKSYCPACIVFFIPFFTGASLLAIVLLLPFLVLALFIPAFISLFFIGALVLVLLNLTMQMPIMSILFLVMLYIFRKDINQIWNQLFISKSYSIQYHGHSNVVKMILLILAVNFIVMFLPVNILIKFVIMFFISLKISKYTHNQGCKS